jgi:hypothetical protein
VTGADFTVVGVHPANTVALLPTSSAPGAAVSILKTDANGGIQLDTNLLYVDGANNWIGVNRTPSGATLDVIAFNNADHTQRLKMKSGQTGRLWRIEDLAGNELIVLDSVGNLQSGQPGFVSGLTGWRIEPNGNAEFNNIWARGELHATVFVKDEVHATGGTLLVATAGVLHDDAIINSTLVDDDVLVIDSTAAGHLVPLEVVTTSGTFTGNQLHVSWIGNIININDPPSGPGFYFNPGDVLRSKTEVATGVTDFWFTVNNATQNSGYSSYSVIKQSGADGTLPKGSAVVSYGQPGSGRILMTSDLNYAPYMDVFTTGPNVWTGAAGAILPRVRLGRLDGIGLPGVSGVEQYGIIAGKDLSDANQGYFIASNLGISLYKADIRLNNGTSDTGLWTADGNLRIGSNVGADATTGFRVYTTTGGGYNAGDVVIGNTSTGNFLRWNQVSGTLQVVGSLVVSDPGTTVTKGYVDTQDAAYDLTAQGYGTTAQSNAQTYSDARRIVAVSAVFTSSAANAIAWGQFTAQMAGGGGRTVATGSATLTTRTFLYINIGLSGTLTLTPTTTFTTFNSPNLILIAVADPATNGSTSATVTVVVGTTFISGGNIFTGSITAASIAANTITAGQIATGTITATQLASDVIVSINNAQSSGDLAQSQAAAASGAAANAQALANSASSTASSALTAAGNAQSSADANLTYSENRRVVGVTGTWTVVDGATISWGSPTALQVKFANQSARTITAQTNHNLTVGRHYLYVDVSGTGTMAMLDATALSSLGVNNALIAVVDTGVDKASISVVAGSTYISGDNILTGSIISNNIKASTIAADRMNVQRLDAMNGTFATLFTGVVEVDNVSNVHSTGKAWMGSANGFFLGWNGTAGNYVFDVGNLSNYLRWNGSTLALKTNTALDLTSDSSDTIFKFTSWRGPTAFMNFNVGGNQAITFNAAIIADHFTANDVLTINYATGLAAGDVIKLNIPGHAPDIFHYDTSGIQSQLSYTGNMTVGGSFIAGGQIVANTTSIRIVSPFTPPSSSSPVGQVGEIRWDRNFIYVWTDAGQWRRAQLNIF